MVGDALICNKAKETTDQSLHTDSPLTLKPGNQMHGINMLTYLTECMFHLHDCVLNYLSGAPAKFLHPTNLRKLRQLMSRNWVESEEIPQPNTDSFIDLEEIVQPGTILLFDGCAFHYGQGTTEDDEKGLLFSMIVDKKNPRKVSEKDQAYITEIWASPNK